MSRPPNRYRRRKLRRRIALGLLALIVPVGAGGFAYWRDTRFPARSEPLAGLPVELLIQDGVKPAELRAIRRGLRATDRLLRRSLRGTVAGPVEARVASSNGCRPFEDAGEAMVGEAENGFLCIDTQSPAWQWMMLKDRLAASAAAGHEYVHVVQGERGCLRSPSGEHYRWLVEGMAEDLAWRALVSAGRATHGRVAREIADDGAGDPNLLPLRAYETEGGRDPEYALWHLATRRLLREAVAGGAADARRPEAALWRFCDRVGAGTPWRRAFTASFGQPVERFYERFEAARRPGDHRFWSRRRS